MNATSFITSRGRELVLIPPASVSHDEWDFLAVDVRPREAIVPDGASATLDDSVIFARRR
jgi:hypothetical protein